MSILDKATVQDTGKRYPVYTRYTVDTKYSPSLEYCESNESRLQLVLGVVFRSKPQFTEQSLKNAKRMLLEHLYEDALKDLRLIRRAIYGGEENEALELIGKLEGKLTDV